MTALDVTTKQVVELCDLITYTNEVLFKSISVGEETRKHTLDGDVETNILTLMSKLDEVVGRVVGPFTIMTSNNRLNEAQAVLCGNLVGMLIDTITETIEEFERSLGSKVVTLSRVVVERIPVMDALMKDFSAVLHISEMYRVVGYKNELILRIKQQGESNE